MSKSCASDPSGSVALVPPPFRLPRVACAVQSDPLVTCFELRTTRVLDRDPPAGADSYRLGIRCHSGGAGSEPGPGSDADFGGRVTSLNVPSALLPNEALYTVSVEVCAEQL